MATIEQLFIDKLNAATMMNPLNPRERVIDYKACVEVVDFDGYIIVKTIRSFERGKGYGRMALRTLTEIADELGLTLTLTPKPFKTADKGLNTTKLTAWYERHGFARNKSSGSMERTPNQKEHR